jgi:predicted helicase
MDNLPNILHQVFLRSPLNLFDEFIIECQKWYSLPAHSLVEMRKRNNKKIRGDIFEEFCVLYLKNILNYENVWRLEDVPDEILLKLSLKRRDMGIDIICEGDGYYTAVQCKYKKHVSSRKHVVTWKELSTFYALCLRTGLTDPDSSQNSNNLNKQWKKYIIMTNCECVTHMGKKTEKDQSICIGTFRNISKENWIKMCGITGNQLDMIEENVNTLSKEELRLKRLAFYDK